MTRRTFLRVLGAGAAATAVVSAIPEALSVIAPESPAWSTGTVGAITYEMLEAAYKSAIIGAEHPTYMVVSPSMARRLGLVFDVEFEEAA